MNGGIACSAERSPSPTHRPSRLAHHSSSVVARLLEFLRWFYRYRTIRLTPDGTRFLLLTFGIGIAAINTGNNLLYLLLAMMLSLVVISGVLSEQVLKHLEMTRRLPAHLYANRPAAAAFLIANRKERFPVFSLHVQDVVSHAPMERGVHLLHLAPGASQRYPYTLLLPRRGRHRLDGVKLVTRFPFGLITKAATLPLPADFIVYPEMRPLAPELFRELTALGREQPVARRGHGAALYNLRDYHSGDDSRSIHWKTTARQGRLIVREAEAEDQRRVTLALPTSWPSGAAGPDRAPAVQAFEQAVSLAASLADFFYRRGFRVRLLAGSQEVPAGSGSEHHDLVLRALALCEPGDALAAPAWSAAVRTLADDTRAGIYTLLVLPWQDERLEALVASATRVVGPGVGGSR